MDVSGVFGNNTGTTSIAIFTASLIAILSGLRDGEDDPTPGPAADAPSSRA